MKRILSALIISTVVVFAAGCSAKSSDEPETSGTMTENAVSEAAPEESLKLNVVSEGQEDAETNDSPQLRAASAQTDMESLSVAVSKEVDSAVAKAILDQNKGSYIKGECSGEGHIIMDVANESNSLKVYTLTMYGEYGFINDMFIKISGSGVIPAVISLQEGKDDSYTVIGYEEPEDGSGYTASLKELFPAHIYSRVSSISDSDRSYLTNAERQYARDYLASIGRSAKTGEYSDVDFQYPDIPEDIKKTIFDRYWEYPDWIGTTEAVENGVRYVYETQWKDYGNNDSMVYLTKYVYDTGEIIRTINVHIDNGVIESSEEKVLKIIGTTQIEKP